MLKCGKANVILHPKPIVGSLSRKHVMGKQASYFMFAEDDANSATE